MGCFIEQGCRKHLGIGFFIGSIISLVAELLMQVFNVGKTFKLRRD